MLRRLTLFVNKLPRLNKAITSFNAKFKAIQTFDIVYSLEVLMLNKTYMGRFQDSKRGKR
jgi:hypothetical protein